VDIDMRDNSMVSSGESMEMWSHPPERRGYSMSPHRSRLRVRLRCSAAIQTIAVTPLEPMIFDVKEPARNSRRAFSCLPADDALWNGAAA
jgi:hypothetical protein